MTKKLFQQLRVPEESFYLQFFEECFNLQFINSLLEFKEKEQPDNTLPFLMRGYTLPIYESFGGQVWEICHKISRQLGFKKGEVEFFVSNDADFNASSILSSTKGKPHVVTINRGLLERVDAAELTFIIGHELGHLIFGHSYVSQVITFVFPNYESLPPLLQRSWDVWSKLCEISCDRLGLLAVRDLESAVRAVFKLSSGLSEKYFNLTFENMLEISDRIFEEMKEHRADVLASHPANALRIKALVAFHESPTWKAVTGHGRRPQRDAVLTETMQQILTLLCKVPSDVQEEIELRFLASAGTLLAEADGVVTRVEHDYLLNILSPYIQWPHDYLAQLPREQLPAIMKKAGRTIREHMPHKTRDLARRLFPIVIRDGRIADPEAKLFLDIAADLLAIPASEVVDIFLEGIRSAFKPYM